MRAHTVTARPRAASIGAQALHKPRICVVGPMVGQRPGHVTHQGQIVADGLRAAGWDVTTVSAHPNRYRRLAEIVQALVSGRRSIDVVLLQVYGGASFVVEDIASGLGRQFRQRVVMALHGGAMPAFMARFPSWSRRVLGRADLIVTPTRFLARALTAHGLHARLIPNTIHLSEYEYTHRATLRPRLLWMRSFHDTYNPMLALRTLALVRQRVPDATLVMGGTDNGLLEAVRREAARSGLAEAIRLPGFLDAAAKRREGRDADIFLNTNRIDNTPVALIEAAAMGLPLVTTNVGGIPDLIADGETGLLVGDDDAVSMADAVLRLLENPMLAGRLSSGGRRLAEQCAWTSIRPQWEAALAQVIA